jgi:hypothetical protein
VNAKEKQENKQAMNQGPNLSLIVRVNVTKLCLETKPRPLNLVC